MSLLEKQKISNHLTLVQHPQGLFTGHIKKTSISCFTAVLLFVAVSTIGCSANRFLPLKRERPVATPPFQNTAASILLPVATIPNQEQIYSRALSPSGRILALGGENMITLWDVFRQKTITTMMGESKDIVSLAFSPDGETLAAGSYQTIDLWHVPSSKHLGTLQGKSGYFSILTFSPDGRILASGTSGSRSDLNEEENTLFLWDVWKKTLKSRLNYTSPYADSILALSFSTEGHRLAATGLDRRIRIWDLANISQRRNPSQILFDPASAPRILTFTPDQKHLVAGTSEGQLIFYDLSTETISRRLNIHQGALLALALSEDGRTLTSIGDDQIYQRLRIKTGVSTEIHHLNQTPETVVMTADGNQVAAQTALGIEIFNLAPQSGSPPFVAIFKPENKEIVYEPRVRLAGKAADDQGISEVVIRINDVVWNSEMKGNTRDLNVKIKSLDRDYSFNEMLQLTPGENTITITAVDIEGHTRTENVTVTYIPDEGEVWAAVIGISDYQHVAGLRYADADAKAFYDYLIHDNQIPEDHVTLLLNEDATLQRLRDLLGVELKNKAGKKDTVLIYYAGHGAPEPDRSSLDGDNLEKYLLPYDADPDRLYSTALPMNEISKIFTRISAERIVMLQDTCFSGSSGGSGLGGRTIQTALIRASISESFLDRMARGKGRVIITASEANEVSLERDDLGHGVFTYYLLESLQKGDVDGDGLISTNEAFAYLSRKVPAATGQNQHPVKKGTETSEIILGRVRKGAE